MTNPDEELRELAEKATPGPWRVYGPWYEGEKPGIEAATQSVIVYGLAGEAAGVEELSDAAYIAAASPDVVLSLLDRLAAAERALTEIADWDAHDETCAALDGSGRLTDNDCSCGWVEVADHAREALGLERVGYPKHEALDSTATTEGR